MSGTSLDGLDLAYCVFNYVNNNWSYDLLNSRTIVYPKEIIALLKEAYTCPGRRLTEIDALYGRFIGETVKQFIKEHKITPNLIASHGHTIFHEPEKGFTLQIGNGAQIASVTGIETVCNFRQLDVALDGQGAPLVPIGDKFLFGDYDVCLNLGGFSNVSFDKDGKRIAFDICAVNFVINALVKPLGLEMDKDGKLAEKGKVKHDLLERLNNIELYRNETKKSLGQEWVESTIFPILEEYPNLTKTDLVCTYTEHAAVQIVKVLNQIDGTRVLLTGGGTFNKYLVGRITANTNKTIMIPDEETVKFKEALIFAFLGVLNICNVENTLSSVTGAKKDSIGGVKFKI